jgi:hypothetical protein
VQPANIIREGKGGALRILVASITAGFDRRAFMRAQILSKSYDDILLSRTRRVRHGCDAEAN